MTRRMPMHQFIEELYRRNVVRSATTYLAFCWMAIEIAHLLDHAIGFSGDGQRWVMLFLTIGLIPVFLFSWRYELMPSGLVDEEELEHPKSVHHRIAMHLDRATIVMLLFAFLLALVDQFAVDPRSPHTAAPIGFSALHDPGTMVRFG
ncbi:MAG: hypothetical protein AAGE01_20890 [Pseudomonadota bacterium]